MSVTVRVRRCISTTVCGRSHGIEDFRISRVTDAVQVAPKLRETGLRSARPNAQPPPPDPRLQDYQLSVFQCGSWDHIHNANFQGECEGVTLGSAPNTYTCPSIPASPVSSSPYLKPTITARPHSVSTFQKKQVKPHALLPALHC